MKPVVTTFDEFFAAADECEPDLRQLDALIQDAAPGLKREVFTGMNTPAIAYGWYYYKYASGREGDWPLVCLAILKNHISLYICATKDGKYLAEIYGARLGKVDNGKSCIRFKKLADLNLGEVKNIVQDAAVWLKEQPAR